MESMSSLNDNIETIVMNRIESITKSITTNDDSFRVGSKSVPQIEDTKQ
ncbi:MAG: hypothetical protein P9L91_05960 [Candidatus Zophobacter franzmannii]|nr:hypothetical protein [Candidatus Zophobacter franzmannii]